MNELIDWLGKADDLSITYDAGVLQNQALPGETAFSKDLPAIVYPQTDNPRDVADVVWEDAVKKADRLDYLMAVCSGAVSGLIAPLCIYPKTQPSITELLNSKKIPGKHPAAPSAKHLNPIPPL